MKVEAKDLKICVVGLGYVGLPLCLEVAKYFATVGFDVNHKRVADLRHHNDTTREVRAENLLTTTAKFTDTIDACADCDIYIITVPTPITNNKSPDFRPLISATECVADVISETNLVIYESTVYPGATRAVCQPIIERRSGLLLNEGFYIAYSPERINPGDKKNSLVNTDKLVGGSNQWALDLAANVYEKILEDATVFRVESIEVAEAAKIIENTQRDVNIALMNEFSEILNELNIPTAKVLQAASTKWNFHNYSPGLVGGHCIGVDPYYLISRANDVGIAPRLISSARYVNENVVDRITDRFLKHYIKSESCNRNVLMIGGTFKENCPDVRNSKSITLMTKLSEVGFNVSLFDSLISADEPSLNKFNLLSQLSSIDWGGVIVCLVHESDRQEIEEFLKQEICFLKQHQG